jgi:hypothetical protein
MPMEHCDHVMRSGGFCGKPYGHPGDKHYTPETLQREIERCVRRRQTPGTCTKPGCDNPSQQYYTGNYDTYCWRHRDLVRSKSLVKKARQIRDMAYRRALVGMRSEALVDG